MKRSIALALGLPLAALALGASACGSSGDKASSDTTVTTAATAEAPTGTAVKASDAAYVEVVQKDLDSVGCWAGAVDGEDGPRTEGAIREFQKAEKLTVNGELDPATQTALQDAASAGKKVCETPPTTAPAKATTTTTAAGPKVSGDCGEFTTQVVQEAQPKDAALVEYTCARDANGRMWVGGNVNLGSEKISANFIDMQGADTPLVPATDADMAACTNPPIPSPLLTYCHSS